MLLRTSRINKEWEDCTKPLIAKDHYFEDAISEMQETVKENLRRAIFQKTTDELIRNIQILLSLLETQKPQKKSLT